MNNIEGYNDWSSTYDTVINKTRDLEGKALRNILNDNYFEKILEIGCGTGKNTEWLSGKGKHITGADFSEGMLDKAREKIKTVNVEFARLDIREEWNFKDNSFDLITFSLILEHIKDIQFVFEQATKKLKEDGVLYLGELHPYKQIAGSKARFDKNGVTIVLDCYLHNISDFFDAGRKNGLICADIKEWYDNDEEIPRLLTMIFRKDK